MAVPGISLPPSGNFEIKEVGKTTRSGEEERIWEVMCHRTGLEAAGEEVGAVGLPECQDGTPQLTSLGGSAPMGAQNGSPPIGLSPRDTGQCLWNFFNIYVFETGSFCIDQASLEIPILLPQPVGWDDR